MHGICKLTGKRGKFVKSHLIPQAFTKPNPPGSYFIISGQGRRPKKTWSSWYDPRLVIEDGEDILAKYDDCAVRELRRLELVWSGWGTQTALPNSSWVRLAPAAAAVTELSFVEGLRLVECADPEQLRLFFLSLLWRAAATAHPDFRDVALNQDDLELLRTMVLNADPRPLDFYPTTLIQIVTRGWSHNLGLIASPKTYRFYFDGLIAYMHNDYRGRDMENAVSAVGASTKLLILTQTADSGDVKIEVADGTFRVREEQPKRREPVHTGHFSAVKE